MPMILSIADAERDGLWIGGFDLSVQPLRWGGTWNRLDYPPGSGDNTVLSTSIYSADLDGQHERCVMSEKNVGQGLKDSQPMATGLLRPCTEMVRGRQVFDQSKWTAAMEMREHDWRSVKAIVDGCEVVGKEFVGWWRIQVFDVGHSFVSVTYELSDRECPEVLNIAEQVEGLSTREPAAARDRRQREEAAWPFGN